MKSNPIPCCHPEVIAVRKWNPYRLEYVHRCTSCHQPVTITMEAA